MRVGRDPIDAEAMRLLEQHNPDVSFDWARLLKSAPAGPAAPARPAREERRRDRRDQRRPGREESRPRGEMPPGAPIVDDLQPHADLEPRDDETAMDPIEPGQDEDGLEAAGGGVGLGNEGSKAEGAGTEGPGVGTLGAEPAAEPEPGAPVVEELLPERYARLGHDGLKRLRARAADVRARLQATPIEDSERDGLLGRAERLNPDNWLTDADVAQALEEYEAVFESLRPFLGRPGRPRRL